MRARPMAAASGVALLCGVAALHGVGTGAAQPSPAVAPFTTPFATPAQPYAEDVPRDHPAIRYARDGLDNPVERLATALDRGATVLDFRPDGRGYLESLLAALGVAADSQTLVFSKTSFQSSAVGPRTPRAVYFADGVAIAHVPGGRLIELAAVDRRHGVVFYALEAEETARPTFSRPPLCLRCHQGPATLGVPGLYVGSVVTTPTGRPDFAVGTVVSDHRTALDERWGGWYVTGTHGAQRHMGNAVAPDPARPGELERGGSQNLVDLHRKLDPGSLLRPTSDLVALMTLEHQTQMINLLTRLSWEARIAASEDGDPGPAGRPLAGDADEVVPDVDRLIDEVVRYMLFADEVPLAEPVRGVSTFVETFPRRGPRDARGRSLRDFDLETRLFRYPLSYMIYSPAFDGLPEGVRQRVYRALYGALTMADDVREGPAAHLQAETRAAIAEIVRGTKRGVPAFWR